MIRRRGFSSFFSSTTTRTKTCSSGPLDSAKKPNTVQKIWLPHIFLLIGAVACYLLLRYQSSALYHTGNESSNPRRHPRPSKETLPQLLKDQQEAIKILYCHIGKTGGEFVKSQLGSVMCKARQNPKLKEECLRQQHEPHSTTRLSNHTIAYTHVGRWIPQNGLGMASHMLFSVRHPVDRFVSWYFYNHPANCDLRDNNSPSCRSQQALSENNPSSFATRFYQNCFPVIGNLFITLKESDIDSKCFQLAKETFQLQLDQRDLNHLFWNYKYYYMTTIAQAPDKKVLVVRTESLEADLGQLEYFLGGDHSSSLTFQPAQVEHITKEMRLELSANEQSLMCCVLLEELKIYSNLLHLAENLTPQQKMQSFQEASQKCSVPRLQDLEDYCEKQYSKLFRLWT